MSRPVGSDELSTIARVRFSPTPWPQGQFHFTVVDGPDRGQSFVMDGMQPSRSLVGHGPACDLQLTDREVSRRHIALEFIQKRIRISDLGSTNGTTVNGIAIAEAYLIGGEAVRIGATTISVEYRQGTSVAPPTATRFGRLLGVSTEMRRLYPLCERLAASDVAVIIEGETGTGKEVLAEAIHEQSSRAEGPFVVFDCTAVPPNLIESELFGHERGAFTGASSSRKGVFEQAHGGTLLIDEIGDLDLALQPKLLRALERTEIRRVGGQGPIAVDVRVLAATRRDLDREVATGRFRDDLFHRLAVTRVELPPLRERAGDVELLARHFCRELGGAGREIPPSILLRWQEHAWPGNVRELRNAVARQLAIGELAEALDAAVDAPVPTTRADSPPAPTQDFLDQVIGMGLHFPEARRRLMDEFERRYIDHALALSGQNVVKAAAASGIARRYFHMLKARAIK